MELSIRIKLKDVTLELSLDEAKKLAEFLADVTGTKKEIIIERIREHYLPLTYDPYPWWPRVTWTTTTTGSTSDGAPDKFVAVYSVSNT